MPNQDAHVAKMFHAMGDATRLGVVERLARGPAPVGELFGAVSMTLPSFLQHLRLLEDCGIIQSEKVGRVRTCSLQPDGLSAAKSWIDVQRSAWASRLEALEDYVAEASRNDPGKDRHG
ncbi:helix-turn-helix transcriptional regulator [Phenylobacterium sp.]|uniref:ArsR/SmtB family transcription factor n=1 Tax=Phenylobacterium sp. TaxID=1871053 RepID=UPI0027368F42|nr:metalloregulator ArsR/SmtB family transcription factor [Phenylobacterium sp.]MDP3855191.1 metalloregulator ArsR/SmtB family transcription factor [Phenylobacterium sp.]